MSNNDEIKKMRISSTNSNLYNFDNNIKVLFLSSLVFTLALSINTFLISTVNHFTHNKFSESMGIQFLFIIFTIGLILSLTYSLKLQLSL